MHLVNKAIPLKYSPISVFLSVFSLKGLRTLPFFFHPTQSLPQKLESLQAGLSNLYQNETFVCWIIRPDRYSPPVYSRTFGAQSYFFLPVKPLCQTTEPNNIIIATYLTNQVNNQS